VDDRREQRRLGPGRVRLGEVASLPPPEAITGTSTASATARVGG
jgi:hypothetical protein